MEDKNFKNNQVSIIGKVVSDYQYSHRAYGKSFYRFEVSASRLSGYADHIPVIVPDHKVDISEDCIGEFVRISGQLRSYNRRENNRSRLILSVFSQKLEFVDATDGDAVNQIFLDGYTCKEPVYRKTPFGREITEFVIAVNRTHGGTDYIPCICWEWNARFASSFAVGSHIRIRGRIQSREYEKKISETEMEQKVAYEVSVNSLKYLYE